MSQNRHFFKLGLFVILAFVLTAVMLIIFGAGKFLKKEFLAETCFDESVQGLDIGSEVKYKGIKIGTVKAITTPSKVYDVPSSYVMVVIALSDDCYVGQTGKTSGERFKKGVDQGLTVALSFKGITGAAYLETDYRDRPSAPLSISWTPKHLYIPSRKSRIKRVGDSLNQLLDNITEINVKGLAQDLDRLVQSVNEKVSALDTGQVTDQAEHLLKELRTTNKQIADFLASKRFTRIVDDAGDSVAHLNTIIENAKAPVDKTLLNFQSASGTLRDQLPELISSLGRTTAMLEQMVQQNTGTVRQALENFKYTAENLNQIAQELKRNPGRLLLERPPGPDTQEGGRHE